MTTTPKSEPASPEGMPEARDRIDGIQALRAIAAIMVGAFHLNAAAAGGGFATPYAIFKHADAGVDLFFVISGFIIFYVSTSRPNLTAGDFINARFWRIYPIYWVVITFYLISPTIDAATSITIAPHFQTDPLTILTSIFLLPYTTQVLLVSWTLTVEIIFYGLFSLTFFRWGPKGFFLAMASWAFASQIYVLFYHTEPSWVFLTLYPGSIEFLFGAMIASLFLKDRVYFGGPVLILGIGLFLLHLSPFYDDFQLNNFRQFTAGIPCALILYGVLTIKKRLPSWAMLLGEASYVFYLIHLIVFSVANKFFDKAFGLSIFNSVWLTTFVLLMAIVAACLVTIFVERPVLNWYKSRGFENKELRALGANGGPHHVRSF